MVRTQRHFHERLRPRAATDPLVAPPCTLAQRGATGQPVLAGCAILGGIALVIRARR